MSHIFFFKNIQALGMQVSSGFTIGFPAITTFTGASEAFCLNLARSLSLPLDSFSNEGILVAFENYQFIDGYRKNRKAGETTYEQVVQSFANTTLHLAFSIKGTSSAAQEALEKGLHSNAQMLLSTMRIAKARLENVGRPIDLSKGPGSPSEMLLRLIPNRAFIVNDASWIVARMRDEKQDLLEGLISATLNHSQRLTPWKNFFESQEVDTSAWKLAAIQNGYYQIDPDGVCQGNRVDSNGLLQPAYVASPTLGLVRFQKPASVRIEHQNGIPPPFWAMHKQNNLPLWLCQA